MMATTRIEEEKLEEAVKYEVADSPALVTDPDLVYHKHVQKQLKTKSLEKEKVYMYDPEMKKKMTNAQRALTVYLLMCDYKVLLAKSEVTAEMKKATDNMAKMNDVNWQVFLKHISDKPPAKMTQKPLHDYEGIQINLELRAIKNDAKTSKLLQLPVLGLRVNLYSGSVTNQKGEVKMFMLTETNVRVLRKRPDENQKDQALQLEPSQDSDKQAFAVKSGAYASKWLEIFKNGKQVFPSVMEMMEGLMGWHVVLTEQRMKGKSKNATMKVIKVTRKTYNDVLDLVQITNVNEPLTSDRDAELGVLNAYSKVSCLVLQLYSMEWGTPPLYAEVNRVARDMNLSHPPIPRTLHQSALGNYLLWRR